MSTRLFFSNLIQTETKDGYIANAKMISMGFRYRSLSMSSKRYHQACVNFFAKDRQAV